MNKIFTIFAAILLTASVFAQSPEKMSYQAVIWDDLGKLATEQEIGMQISILQGTTDGAAVYVETQTPTTNTNGLVCIEIGAGMLVSGDFTAIDWASGPYFIKTETSVEAPLTTYTITGISQLMSVPYALHAKTAETVTATQTLAAVISNGNSANGQIKNVSDPTDVQDAATKAYVDELEAKVSLLETALVDANIHPSKFKDNRDGNIYNYVTIGNQVWMAENLKYLPSVVGPGTGSVSTAYYYVYGYDGTNVTDAQETSNYDTYGVLYNWSAAMNNSSSSTANPSGVQGVCPDGWHLPSDAEWYTELIDYLGENAGGKLKETGTSHWFSPNEGATNETGFRALPGGGRGDDRTFFNVGLEGNWRSATEDGTIFAWSRFMYYDFSHVIRFNYTKEVGFSVRCVRD